FKYRLCFFRFFIISLHHRRTFYKNLVILSCFYLDPLDDGSDAAEYKTVVVESRHRGGGFRKAVAIFDMDADAMEESVDLCEQGRPCARHKPDSAAEYSLKPSQNQ